MNEIETAATTLPRFTFIAEFLVSATRRKADREVVNGYQVRKVRGEYRVIWTALQGSPVMYATKDAAKLFDYVRRGRLCYFVRQAEELRVAAHDAKPAKKSHNIWTCTCAACVEARKTTGRMWA
jgi:hypothetical protein